MMQILNKVFIENWDRPLFWNKKGRVPILLVNGKERAAVPSMKKGGRKKEAGTAKNKAATIITTTTTGKTNTCGQPYFVKGILMPDYDNPGPCTNQQKRPGNNRPGLFVN